jgi:hypothetical protein
VSHKLSRILDNLHLEVPRRKDMYVDPKERTLASVIRLMRTDDVMTATVKEALIASAGTTNVSDLAHLDGGGLAELLIDAVPMLAEAGDPSSMLPNREKSSPCSELFSRHTMHHVWPVIQYGAFPDSKCTSTAKRKLGSQ